MKRAFPATILATLLFCFFSLQAAFENNGEKLEEEEKSAPVYIKALIAENIEGALIDVRGSYKVYNPEDGKVLSSGFRGKRYYLQTNKDGLKWGEGYPGIHQIKIVPTAPETTLLIDGIQYKGNLEVYNINSKIQLVNEVDTEDYLRSVLSHEFATQTHEPVVCDAIAIAARTHIYNLISYTFNPYWDVNARLAHYYGEGQTRINALIERAVLSTKGMIMTYNDRPFSTTWTEHCGGKTASYEALFRKRGDGPDGVLVGYAQRERGNSKWQCTLPNQQLAKMLRLNHIDAINLYQDVNSKKVYAIRFSDKQQFVEMTVFEFQKLIGHSRILSTDFSVNLVKDDILFDGHGRGPGVGLCLFTADQMARTGHTMPQILVEFYPSTHIVKLSKMPVFFKQN